MLRIGLLQTGKLELIQEERSVQPQMVRRTNGDRTKHLRVLILRRQALGEQVIQRFVERNRNEIRSLHVPLSIHDRVSERELHILAGHEREHIRCHELIGRTIFPLRHAFPVVLHIIIGAIRHITRQPRMEIVELKPLAGCQLERNHRHSRIMCGENIRTMLCVTPSDAFALHTDRTPPGIQRYSAS